MTRVTEPELAPELGKRDRFRLRLYDTKKQFMFFVHDHLFLGEMTLESLIGVQKNQQKKPEL